MTLIKPINDKSVIVEFVKMNKTSKIVCMDVPFNL